MRINFEDSKGKKGIRNCLLNCQNCWINTYLRVVENGFAHPFNVVKLFVATILVSSTTSSKMVRMGDTIIKR